MILAAAWMNLEKKMCVVKGARYKGHVLHDSIYAKCPEEANPFLRKSTSVDARGWMAGGTGNDC